MDRYIQLFLSVCLIFLFMDLILVQSLSTRIKRLKGDIEVLEYVVELWERDYTQAMKTIRQLREELQKCQSSR